MSIPLPVNEAARLEELRRHALLGTPPEKAFESITDLTARIFKVPIAAVTLIDADRQWFKSCVGLKTREVGRNFNFCTHAILSDGVMVVPDAREDARFADSQLVTGAPFIRFYAGAPLRMRNGLNVGTLNVSDTEPRTLTPQESALLADLATLVVDEIHLRYAIGECERDVETLRLLGAAVQQSSESVVIITGNLRLPGPEIVFVNPAFTRLIGYSAEEVIGKTPRMFLGPKSHSPALNDLRVRLKHGEEFRGDLIFYRKDGSDFITACNVSPIYGENGITHYICFQHDATERGRAAASLQRAKEEAERANLAKSAFLSRMSHELRTPLHAILGYAQLLEMDGLNVDDKESVAQISRAGRHLLGLINEVLDIARVESGKLALTPEPVNVRETLEETLSLVKLMAAERRVSLELRPDDLDCEVLSSEQRFKQVILNLLSNAVKFNRAGGSVVMSYHRFADCVRIKVADTGRGLSAENMAKLFVSFERLDVGDTVVEGAGLGLALSKHLVEAMGGRIGVESELGQGATFWVELPLVQEIPAATARDLGTASPAGTERPHPGVLRTLLYIEDNLSNLRLVERILARRPQVKLISAMQGSLGLEFAHQHQPDVILLDLNLPDIPGDEILRQLRTDPRSAAIPIVVITADASPIQVERLLAAGAKAYLTKPIDLREFLTFVDAVEPRNAQGAPP